MLVLRVDAFIVFHTDGGVRWRFLFLVLRAAVVFSLFSQVSLLGPSLKRNESSMESWKREPDLSGVVQWFDDIGRFCSALAARDRS